MFSRRHFLERVMVGGGVTLGLLKTGALAKVAEAVAGIDRFAEAMEKVARGEVKELLTGIQSRPVPPWNACY